LGAAVGRGPPLRLEGERDITIGAGTWFGSGCWLNAIGGTITVGDGCSFAGDVTISAAASVTLGRDVLVARGVHLGDHDHAFTDAGGPASRPGIANAAPVMIGDGAWLGHNVTVTAGVSIGRARSSPRGGGDAGRAALLARRGHPGTGGQVVGSRHGTP
jgi:acetyltransferase-like isoleucine patch superfamily enzyme